MQQICKTFCLRNFLHLFDGLFLNIDQTNVKPDVEEMCCKSSSYIIYLQNNVNSYLNCRVEFLKDILFSESSVQICYHFG